MNLKISNWESEGLRCPDGIVDLKKNGFKRFNFIQMPNFSGKTTYKELIQSALTGSLIKETGKKISQYRDLSKPENGFFKLEVNIDSQNIIFEIRFEFTDDEEESKVKYFTTYSDGGGENPGWEPPKNIKKLLNPEFVKLFVFDGETASDLLDSTKSKAFECIDALCNLNIFDDIKKDLSNYFDKRFDDSTTKGQTQKAITAAKNKHKKLEERIDEIQNNKLNYEKDLKRLTKEIDHLNKVIEGDKSVENENK